MILINKINVYGFEAAIRGMRNPMNSWKKSDTLYVPLQFCDDENDAELARICGEVAPIIKKNDHDLMMKLRNAGTDHRKFMRMITVYADITAPLYWWKEFDTNKVGTVANSCSTMHTIHKKEFSMDDFSFEHLTPDGEEVMRSVLNDLNFARIAYLESKNKDYWYEMIQMLPSSYNQKRTVMLNYEVLCKIYHSRKNHKIDEWHTFCDWIKTLPYSELIIGGEDDADV